MYKKGLSFKMHLIEFFIYSLNPTFKPYKYQGNQSGASRVFCFQTKEMRNVSYLKKT
jgi:hypothetical protein